MLYRLLTFALLFALGCGDEGLVYSSSEGGQSSDAPTVGSKEHKLTLVPTIEVNGTQQVFAELDIDRISFDAELFLLPVDAEADHAGDAISLHFDFENGQERTSVSARPISLAGPGKYRVLLRVHAAEETGVSLDIGGLLSGPVAQRLYKATEPAPTAADGNDEEPAPTAASEKCEPAPTAADGNDQEPAPTAANEICEPAPTAADGNDEAESAYEPAPTAADGNDPPSAEPAPTAAEPAPTAAREKASIDSIELAENEDEARLSVSSRQEFDFYAGVVDVRWGDQELVVAWDVRTWLRSVLAEPLGISPEAALEAERLDEPGFDEMQGSFELSTL